LGYHDANKCWIDELLYSQKSCVIVSEDLAEPVIVQEEMQGKFAVVFDPLTGLSDPPAPDMGGIFGVFYQVSGGTTPGIADVLQPAKNLIAAGYALYSSCTTLMFSIGDGLHQFTLDSSMNEFILTRRDVKMPFHGTTYSINEGYTSEYDAQTQQMLAVLKSEPALNGIPRSARYIGSMVADIHRTILKGGIYLYPATKQRPNGKLKLLYEAGPMAWLVNQAGGHASTGKLPIIDIRPDSVHTTVPAFLGSEDEVSLATGMYIKTPWGTGNYSDPMYAMRRKNSITKKQEAAKRGIVAGDDADDGIICCHLGIPGA